MAARQVLLLGDPRLHQVCQPVKRGELNDLKPVLLDLHDTLFDFRARYGAGRAIAAPQIGVMKRLVYMHIDRPVIFINPSLDHHSQDLIEVWDDCMSFPELLVKVRRHRSCRLTFRDRDWAEKHLELSGDLSELLQHECDHLDGVLALERAVDGRSFAYRSQRELLGGQ